MFEPVVEIVANQAGYYGIPRGEAFRRAEKYLRQLGLWDKRRDMARNLSGGMKRRLMIARALVHEPRLLILDEPTAGVDIEIRRSMWDFLREINAAGTTIILTTHYLEEAESLCRNIAIIDEGELIENTSTSNCSTRCTWKPSYSISHTPCRRRRWCARHTLRLVDEHHPGGGYLAGKIPSIRLFTELTGQGIRVLSMRNKTNRLEELFMRLVEETDATVH